jgi:hypothetical protein
MDKVSWVEKTKKLAQNEKSAASHVAGEKIKKAVKILALP